MRGPNASWVIWLTLFVALVLYVLPIPLNWRWYRPELPMLVLFYWSLALPHRVGIISAALVGLGLDLLDGAAVGALALGMAMSNLSVLLSYQRIRQFDGLQQSVVVGLLVALSLMIERWLQNLVGIGASGFGFLCPVPMSILLWVPVRNALRIVRRYYEVA